MDVRVGLWRRLSAKELMLLNCGVGEDSWEFLWTARRSNQSILKISPRMSLEGMMMKLKLQYWSTSTLWKRLWCWEGLGEGGEEEDRGWDGWMASWTRWTWVWVNSGSWWWTGRPGVLWFMGSQRVRHDWVTELNWMLPQERLNLSHQMVMYSLFQIAVKISVEFIKYTAFLHFTYTQFA